MENELLDGLYWEYWYNEGNDKSFACPEEDDHQGPCPVAKYERNILYENRMLGLPRYVRMLIEAPQLSASKLINIKGLHSIGEESILK